MMHRICSVQLFAFLALFLQMTILVHGASIPPINEGFDNGAIPGSLFYETITGEGRIAIAYDETDAITNRIPLDPTGPSPYNGGNRMRGNYYRCDNSGMLMRFGMQLGRTDVSSVMFTIYQGATSNGTYSLIASNVVSAPVGTDMLMSDAFNVILEQGKYYLFAAAWTNDLTYYTKGSHPVATDFGTSIKGYQFASYPPPSNVSAQFTTVYLQQLEFTVNDVVRLDDRVNNQSYSTNNLILFADLAGYNDVTLRFRHRDWWDEGHPDDGIFLSASLLQTPIKIYDLDVNDQDWHAVTIDLDAAAASNGIPLTSTMFIIFKQTDNYGVGTSSASSDGREFDDIQLFAPPDFIFDSLTSNGSTIIKKHWKVGEKLVFPLLLNYEVLNGGSDLNVDITHSFALKTASGLTRWNKAIEKACVVPALERSILPISTTFSVPAEEIFTNLNYSIQAITDAGFDVAEPFENNNTGTIPLLANHYSGRLWFDDIETAISITDWGTRVTDSATEHWITGSGSLSNKTFNFVNLHVVKDQQTLDYRLTATNNTTFTLWFPLRYEVGGLTYWRDNGVELSRNGAYADIRVLFPAGLGVSTNSHLVMESQWTFENQKLNQSLYPSSPPSLMGSFRVVEESKPLGYHATQMVWTPETGAFRFAKHGVWFVREAEYRTLQSATGFLVDPSMAEKKSNAQYFQAADQLTSDISVSTGPYGDARLDAELQMTNVHMVAHFPYDVTMSWSADSSLSIEADLVNGGSSQLKDPSNGSITYQRDCIDAPSCAGSVGKRDISFAPTGNSTYSIDGGIRTPASIVAGGNLQWGTRYNHAFTQQTTNFTAGTLYIPGTFIRGDHAILDVTGNTGPAQILLSGMSTNSLTTMERYGEAGYADGYADYAGLNMRVSLDGSGQGHSILGGTNTGWWTQTDRSKYYVRWAGVSGIHEAIPESFNGKKMTIYGYGFRFYNFGLSFLANKPQESRITGQVYVPDPSDITMDFEELMVNCLGELGPAELANSDLKTLDYWDADIQPLSLFFAPTAASTCANAARVLCMGLTTRCANIDQLLSGILGFKSDGNLGTPADQIEGVLSRLAAPNKIELDGPGDEIYYFNPVAMPYYNDYANSGDNMSSNGWINFAGNLDVAFFTDLPVHFHTSASTNGALAPIYMTGGWEEDGITFFNASDLTAFDPGNHGYPSARTNKVAYRNPPDPSSETYRTRAQRKWLNMIDLDYPLEWSSAAKSFKSPETENVNLLVLDIEHQTDYLSAENAEISFGVQYDGLPQINLANMAFNAINESTGMASAFGNSVGDALHDAIEDGVNAMDSTLSDLPEDLFDPVFEATLDPLIIDFYGALSNAYDATPNADYYSTVVTQYIHGTITPGGVDNVDYVLKHLANNAAAANTLVNDIDERLDQALMMIDGFIGTVPNGPDPALPGLLFQTDGTYSTLTDLGIGILEVLANSLYSSLQGTLEEELSGVLDEAQPSLAAITDALTEVRSSITNVQAQLDSAGSFTTELTDTLDTVALNEPLERMSTRICNYLASLPGDGASFDDYTPDEIKAILRQIITDEFYGSEPCADVQNIVRSRLYEVDAALREAIDSAFQQLNKAIRDLASGFLSGIDDEINGLLGDLSDIMGSGEIDGYAHIRGDTLSELRLDGKFQWEIPDTMSFNAYLIIKQLESTGSGGCGVVGEQLPEVTLGTERIGIAWLGSDIKADISTKFAFRVGAETIPDLIGLGGSFKLVEGEIGFESFAIDKLEAHVAFGALENHLSANVGCKFTSYAVEGGVFFGKACDLEPFSWDPEVQSVLGDPPFTGIYIFGKGWMPIVDYGCLFRLKAGVGAGIFAFLDGPVGGKIFLGASGEALCVVGVEGDATLVGLKDGNNLRMKGKGKISGRAGACPFCVKFSKTVTFEYNNGSWSADY